VALTVTPDPFPHLVADGRWDRRLLWQVRAEFVSPHDPRWRRYDNPEERKLEGPEPMWGPATRELLAQVEQSAGELAEVFGLPPLSMETAGGGWHLIPPGGFLAVHADFNRSPTSGRYRRLNHLIYLNPGWAEAGGALELWDAQAPRVAVAPEFGRTVVFATSSTSWHGHPRPADRWRASVAAYFYTQAPPPDWQPGGEHSTVWHPAAAAAARAGYFDPPPTDAR
jgi:Rps23 Pro-64 3,4-dihydroxylase Tpa1-like proline 4-hydroxylase